MSNMLRDHCRTLGRIVGVLVVLINELGVFLEKTAAVLNLVNTVNFLMLRIS